LRSTASEPLDILYGKTAATPVLDAFSSSYNALQAKLEGVSAI